MKNSSERWYLHTGHTENCENNEIHICICTMEIHLLCFLFVVAVVVVVGGLQKQEYMPERCKGSEPNT